MANFAKTDDEVRDLVLEVLAKITVEAGFRGATVVSDYDHDGEPILRIKAHYERRPDAKPDPLMNSIHAVRATLMERGEERSIIMTNEVEAERQHGENLVEEDID